jgi:tetratricopeptide (TPR) repeat protein
MSLSMALLHRLDAALISRRVDEGFRLLDRTGEALDRLAPDNPLAPSFLLNLAQWVDLGYRDHRYIKSLLSRFSSIRRAEMKLVDFIQVRMTEAFLAFSSEDSSSAISILAAILAIQTEVPEEKIVLLAHYWKGRAHRQKGEYDLAMHHILEAKRQSEQMNAPKLTAAIQIHESWLLFQRGQRKDAFRLLAESESELKTTGHDLALGNIESARGRYVRRAGEYARALEHFKRAVAIYSGRFPNHPNLARALVNAAYVKRLIAFDLRHRGGEGRARGVHHDRYLRICREALGLLERAREIYALQGHLVGTGAVLVNAGYVHLESDDLDKASDEATKAFSLGEEKQDHILMARARILQAAIENIQVDEQVGDAEDISNHANLAAQHADEAIEYAKLTQNRRLLAGAFVARGSTAANSFFEEWEAAKQFVAYAGDLLRSDDRDHLSKELLLLKSRILRAIGIDQTLRAWCDGLMGDKTFQQVTEEFAEIVIPKVWLREDRKVSKVATKLSISPKKVRRILRNAHLLP